MKRFILIALLVFAYGSLLSQTLPPTPGTAPRSNSSVIPEDYNISIRAIFLLPRFSDSLGANTYTKPFFDTCGRMFFNYSTNSVWVRKCDPKRWEEIGAASVNIYNSDGTLTGNRSLNGDGLNLFFEDVGDFRVYGTGAFVNERLLATEGSTGTSWLGRINEGRYIEIRDSMRMVGVDESASTGLYFPMLNPTTGAVTKIAVSSVVTNDNIYNINGTLTGDRVLSGDAHDLLFDNLDDFNVYGTGAYAPEILIRTDGLAGSATVGRFGTGVYLESSDSLRLNGIEESASTGLYVPLLNPTTGALTKVPIADVEANVIAGRGLLKSVDTLYGNFIDSSLVDSLQQMWSPIGTWGNSLTFGSTGIIGGYPTYLMQLARRFVYNGGVVGEIAASVRARFMAQSAYFRRPNVIWVGRNDLEASLITARNNILTNIAQMVDSMTYYGNSHYLICGMITKGGQGIGTAGYDTLTAINTTLSQIYGERYVDLNTWLVANYNPASPPDVANHAQNVVPLSLRVDSIHLTNPGYLLVAQYIYNNYRYILLDTLYTEKIIDANLLMSLFKGRLSSIGMAAGGSLSIGSQQIAYVPSLTLTQESMFLGDGGASITSAAVLNTSVGVRAMQNITSGSSNTAVGARALQLCTTCLQNVAIGRFAALNTTTATGITTVGYGAALNNTTGNNNVALGNQALPANTTGSNNISIGSISLFTANGGGNNVAIGHSSMVSTTSASNNTGVGFESLRNNTTGTQNVSMGVDAGYFNNTGSNNVFIGGFSGWGNASAGAVSSNTAIGHNTLRIVAAGADSNVIVGAASVTTTALTGDRNLIIGYGIEPPATTTRDYGSIGNVIYMRNGTYSTGVSPFGLGTAIGSNNIGIQNSNPTAKIHIAAGTTAASTAPLKFTTGTSMTTEEAGAVEFTTDDLFFTITTGTARKRFVFADPTAGLTSGQVAYATTNGRLTGSANLTVTGGGGLTIGSSGATINSVLSNTASLDFPSTAAGASSDLTITVTGSALNDVVMIGTPAGSVPDNGAFSAWVSATNTVTIRYSNNDLTNAKDPAIGTFRATVIVH